MDAPDVWVMPAESSGATSGAGTPREPKVAGSPWTSGRAGPGFSCSRIVKESFRIGSPHCRGHHIRGNQSRSLERDTTGVP